MILSRITTTGSEIIVRPAEYAGALRNPLGGFRPALGREHVWGTLCKHYIDPARDTSLRYAG